ncbi:MAG: hypothetical protein EB127_12280 [Alphaproteobacteria bacterium]|nr:hypothetical protein [Alphaproteobacteria bacterium]
MKKIFTPLFAFIVVVITVAILVIDELDYVEIQALYPAPQEIMHNLQPEEDLYIVNFLASWCPSCEKELKYFGLIKTYMDIPIF